LGDFYGHGSQKWGKALTVAISSRQRADEEMINVFVNGGKKYNELGFKDTLRDKREGRLKKRKKKNKSRKCKRKKERGRQVTTSPNLVNPGSSSSSGVNQVEAKVPVGRESSKSSKGKNAERYVKKRSNNS
jgi:hypothetical protein